MIDYMKRVGITMVCVGAALAALPACADEIFSGLPDPTRPSTATGEGGDGVSVARQGLALQSVLVSPQRRLAVINGRTLAVGERIGDATVVAIRPHEVVVRRAGNDITLRLLPRFVTHAASGAAPLSSPEDKSHAGSR